MTDDVPAVTATVQRLTRRGQYLYVRDGVTVRCACLVVQARRRAGETPGAHIGEGFTATKKIGNAVVRNRAKRRLREAARRLLPLHGRAGCDYVFIAREATAGADWSRLLDDMERALISLAGV